MIRNAAGLPAANKTPRLSAAHASTACSRCGHRDHPGRAEARGMRYGYAGPSIGVTYGEGVVTPLPASPHVPEPDTIRAGTGPD